MADLTDLSVRQTLPMGVVAPRPRYGFKRASLPATSSTSLNGTTTPPSDGEKTLPVTQGMTARRWEKSPQRASPSPLKLYNEQEKQEGYGYGAGAPPSPSQRYIATPPSPPETPIPYTPRTAPLPTRRNTFGATLSLPTGEPKQRPRLRPRPLSFVPAPGALEFGNVPRSPKPGKHMWRRVPTPTPASPYSTPSSPMSSRPTTPVYFTPREQQTASPSPPINEREARETAKRIGHRPTRSRSAPPGPAPSPSLYQYAAATSSYHLPSGVDHRGYANPLPRQPKRASTLNSLPAQALKLGPSDVQLPEPGLHRPTPFWRHTRRSGVTASSYAPAHHVMRRSTFIAAGLPCDVPGTDYSALGVEARLIKGVMRGVTHGVQATTGLGGFWELT